MNDHNNMNQNLVGIFAVVSQRLRRRQLVHACAAALGLAAAAALCFNAIDRLTTIREMQAFFLLSLAWSAVGLFLVVNLLRIVLLPLRPEQLALAVEKSYPEFMDELVCAVEVQKNKTVPNALEQALVEKVSARTADLDFSHVLTPKYLQWNWLLLYALLFAGLLALAVNSQFVRKAAYHTADMLAQEPSGLRVKPGNQETPIHSDMTVRAEIARWQNQATIEYYDEYGLHRYPMNPSEKQTHFFTFYNLTDSLRYRVVTPALKSRWYQLHIYTPPQIEVKKFELIPPAYTGRTSQVYDELREISSVAGSRVRLRIRSEAGSTVDFRLSEAVSSRTAAANGAAEYDFVLDADAILQVKVRNSQLRTAQTPEFQLTAEPDWPPIVDIIHPKEDVKAKPDTTVAVEARAGDDFGLRSVELVYSVSGAPRQTVVLFAHQEDSQGAEGQTGDLRRILDKTVRYNLDLAALEADAGDVLSCFFIVSDNREPDPQTVRSELFFIEVRPEIEAQEDEAAGQEQQEMEVASLIAELKRLIRMTWDTLAAVDERRQERQDELLRGMKELKLETRRKYNEMKAAAGGAAGGPLFDLMEEAENEIGKAEALISRKLLDESLPSQERALARLVALETELMKNAAQSSQSQEEGDKSTEKQQQQQHEKESRSQEEQLALLQQLLEKVRQLSRQQNDFNESVARRLGQQDSSLAEAMAERQGALRQELKELQNRMQQNNELQRAARDTERAAVEMEQGRKRLQGNDLQGGLQHGKRSSNFLSAAIQSIEEAYRQAAANRVSALTQAAQQLADEQRAAAGTSRDLAGESQPQADAVDTARHNQAELNEKSKALQQAIRRTAEEFSEMFPEVGRDLDKAAAMAQQENLDGKMSRSVNALLYRQFQAAARSQTDAANTLQQLSSALQEAARQLPALSREELLQALNNMRRHMQQAQKAGQQEGADAEKELEQIRESASRDVDALASALQDPSLQQIGDELALPMGGSSSAGTSQRLISLFQATSALLEKHLLVTELRRRFLLSRRLSEPPAEYKRLVEQYFKDLSETP